MRGIQNDYNKMMLQNALMAQQVQEAGKNRQTDRARAEVADQLEKINQAEEDSRKQALNNKVSESKKEGESHSPKYKFSRYRPDGKVETEGSENGPDPSSLGTSRIDIKA